MVNGKEDLETYAQKEETKPLTDWYVLIVKTRYYLSYFKKN